MGEERRLVQDTGPAHEVGDQHEYGPAHRERTGAEERHRFLGTLRVGDKRPARDELNGTQCGGHRGRHDEGPQVRRLRLPRRMCGDQVPQRGQGDNHGGVRHAPGLAGKQDEAAQKAQEGNPARRRGRRVAVGSTRGEENLAGQTLLDEEHPRNPAHPLDDPDVDHLRARSRRRRRTRRRRSRRRTGSGSAGGERRTSRRRQ